MLLQPQDNRVVGQVCASVAVHIIVPDICLRSNGCFNHELLFVLGIHGEHSESEGGVYDLSNKRRLGLTEYAAVREMLDGVLAIKKWEEELAAKA